MLGVTFKALFNRVALLVFIVVTATSSPAVGQCIDSSEVNNFKVRSVTFRSLFGRVPKKLRTQLEGYKGESYSAIQASKYIREIDRFLDNDPIQQKYEALIANKLKFSVKGAYTELDCVKKLPETECQQSFAGEAVTECVDVVIRRYAVEVDGLDSSPYLLLFPRSTLTALYEALPRPLLALNPNLDVNQDRSFGPSFSVDTATDLLDLFDAERPTVTSPPAPASTPLAVPISSDDVEITLPGVDSQESSGTVESGRNTKLLLTIKARKSLTKDFYDTNSRLVVERVRPLERFQSFKFNAAFDSNHVPHGDGEFLRNRGSVGLFTDIRLRQGPFQLINFGGSYDWSRNRFTDPSGVRELTSEHGFEARLLLDGVIKKGMTRAAIWFDSGSPDIATSQYRRLATTAGFGKEFIIKRKKRVRQIRLEDGGDCWTSHASDPKKNEQSVGLEVTAGAGRIWGPAPEYARFFGGNRTAQFLYDELSSPAIQDFPSGPLLRSLGHQQAGTISAIGGAQGATSYWHANVNLSLPIAAWSVPLIPHAWVGPSRRNKDDDEFGNSVPEDAMICRDLKYMVKRQVRRSGMILMIHQEAFNSLSDEHRKAFELQEKPNLTQDEQALLDAARQAYAQAKVNVRPNVEELFNRDVLPISDFIADHANLIAVKPLLMFDVSHLRASRGAQRRTLYGTGPGLQVDVVLARFEAGYVFALNREPGDPKGNFIARLVFRRLF